MTKIMAAATAAVMMTISSVSAEDYFSHTSFIDVQSSSDGNGNFTYSFFGSSINPDFGFYFTPGSGTISIQAYDILNIQTPPGWQGSASSDGFVTFQYTGSGGAWIQDVPLTFGLSSSIAATEIYDGVGLASGPWSEYGNPNNGGWGIESFSYIGPEVPEPSATAFFVLGSISLALPLWMKGREGRTNRCRQLRSIASRRGMAGQPAPKAFGVPLRSSRWLVPRA